MIVPLSRWELLLPPPLFIWPKGTFRWVRETEDASNPFFSFLFFRSPRAGKKEEKWTRKGGGGEGGGEPSHFRLRSLQGEQGGGRKVWNSAKLKTAKIQHLLSFFICCMMHVGSKSLKQQLLNSSLSVFSFFAFDQFRDGLFSLPLTFFLQTFLFVVRTDLHKSLPTTKEGDARLSDWGPEMSLPVVFCRGDAGAYWVYVWLASPYWGKRKTLALLSRSGEGGKGWERSRSRNAFVWFVTFFIRQPLCHRKHRL